MSAQPEGELISTDDNPVYALAAPTSFGQPGVACFAARRTGLVRSENGGQAWLDAYTAFLSGMLLATSSVALSPEYEHDHIVFAGVHGGVVRSNDGGHTWRSAIFPPPAPIVVSLVISPNFGEDNSLFAGTAENGVFSSNDGGASWAAWNFGLLDMNILCLAISPDFAKDETLFAGTTTGLFSSTNGGRAWREVVLPADLPAVLSLAVSPHYRDDRTLYAGTEEHGLFYRSVNNIQAEMRWEKLGQTSLTEPINAILLASDFPKSSELLILHGSELRYSANRGEAFHPWTRPGLPADFEVTAVAAPNGFSPGSPVLIGGGGGEVLVV
jgi:photosystem II stability/assembly factor-like uncharacterized protein